MNKEHFIRLRDLKDTCFQDYKKPSMILSTCFCDWKCWKDLGGETNPCQNCSLYNSEILRMKNNDIIDRYLSNPITSSIIIAGLEPILQFDEVIQFISDFRESSADDVLIYTGYYPNEINKELKELSKFKNIILKCGRFIPNSKPRYDDILGITLVSDNQYGMIITPDVISLNKDEEDFN